MNDQVNVLLVDDQPAKLLANEEILRDLGENLVKTSSAREALEFLLKNDAAVVLIDVCMPELDGFQLAAMIRDHPRFQRTAIIFISAIQVDDVDRLRGYEMGAVDYVPVPVVPAVLRAKVKVFAELYRKTRELERFNSHLERRVAERTAELEASTARLLHSEQQLRLATEAAEIGLWDVDNVTDTLFWPPLVKAMFGISPDVTVSMADFYAGLHPDDREATSRPMPRPATRNSGRSTMSSTAPLERKTESFVGWRRRAEASSRPTENAFASLAPPSTSPSVRRPRSGRICWRAKSIIAPEMRWPSCNRLSG